MIIPEFDGLVENGKLIIEPHEKDKLNGYLTTINGIVKIRIMKPSLKKGRSKSQNDYYWGICEFIAENTPNGYTKNEWHGIFKQFFLEEYSKKIVIGGKRFVIEPSTASLTTNQMSEYIEQIRNWTAGEPLNIYVPSAEEWNTYEHKEV